MEEKIMVRIESVYGNRLIYPVNSKALLIAKLMKKKTFDKENIIDIQKLGFEVEVEQEALWFIIHL